MIQKFLFPFCIVFIFLACDQQELRNLKINNHTLKTENSGMLEEIESYIRIINEIESNLTDIKERENLITLNTLDDIVSEREKREAILTDIKTINDLMVENKNKITHLQNKLNDSNSEFEKMVSRLSKRIKAKNDQIDQLKEELKIKDLELGKLTYQVTNLTNTVDTLTKTYIRNNLALQTSNDIIKEKDELLNTGFFTIGSRKDLKLKQVIEDEGGILGIGSVQQLKTDFNHNAFRQIDIRMTNIIPIDTKKLTLITNHPKTSYKLFFNDKEDKIEALEITDPNEFWNSSKYLVVMTN